MKNQWILVARFPTDGDVEFVKVHKIKGILRCTCREFLMSMTRKESNCKHTVFCDEYVIDEMGTFALTAVVPDSVRDRGKLVTHWMERHVQSFFPDEMDKRKKEKHGDHNSNS